MPFAKRKEQKSKALFPAAKTFAQVIPIALTSANHIGQSLEFSPPGKDALGDQ
jgi:hypothetical protein